MEMLKQLATGIPIGQQQQGAGGFSTGLFDCFSNIPICCLTCYLPCVTFGMIAEIVDKGSSSCVECGALYVILSMTGCQCIYSWIYGSKLKSQFGMQENSIADFCTHCWCEPCVLCQEYRELEHRGYNVVSGWEGNRERQNAGMVAPPSMAGGMTR